MIYPLNSLRFFAVFAIFLRHLDFFYFKYPGGAAVYDKYFSYGYVGVTFFILLSGFILTVKYFPVFCKPHTFSIQSFYIKRILRIYPMHVITLLLSLPLVQSMRNFTMLFLANLFLIQSFFPNTEYYFSFNIVSWILSDLLVFYLLFPFMLLLLRQMKVNSRLYSLLLILIIWLSAAFFISSKSSLNPTVAYWLFYISPYFRFAEFAIGVLLGLIYLKRPDPNGEKPDRFSDTLLELISIGLLVVFLEYSSFIPQPYLYSVYFIPVISMGIYVFARSKGLLAGVLSNHVLVKLGDMSFMIFILHLVVINYLLSVFRYIRHLGPGVLSILAFLITICISYVSARYISRLQKRIVDTLIRK